MESWVAEAQEKYPHLPESAIRSTIEFCLENPDKYPDGWESMDLSRPVKPKEDKEITIEGAVEIFDNPDDPRLKIIKHKEGATILTAEEAQELQDLVSKALEEKNKLE